MAIGSPALLFVDWATKIIYVQKDYMSVVQTTPTEIRELNTLILHQDLRDLEDDEEGIVFDFTHNFVGPITVGGVALAQVIEITNGYTLTFEENPPAGSPPCPVPYAVNLQGSNNNIADRANVNSVSIRSSNSAGLTFSKEIQDLSFEDARVWVDSFSGQTTASFPSGTPQFPVLNFGVARNIVNTRLLPNRIHLKGTMTLTASDDIRSWNIRGENSHAAQIDFGGILGSPIGVGSPTIVGVQVNEQTTIENCEITGFPNGTMYVRRCEFNELVNFQGEAYESELTNIIVLGGAGSAHDFVNCYSGKTGSNLPPIIDCNELDNLDLSIRRYAGALELTNITQSNSNVSIDLDVGKLIIGPSNTAGSISVRGVGELVDNSGPNCEVIDIGLVESNAGARAFGGM